MSLAYVTDAPYTKKRSNMKKTLAVVILLMGIASTCAFAQEA